MCVAQDFNVTPADHKAANDATINHMGRAGHLGDRVAQAGACENFIALIAK